MRLYPYLNQRVQYRAGLVAQQYCAAEMVLDLDKKVTGSVPLFTPGIHPHDPGRLVITAWVPVLSTPNSHDRKRLLKSCF